MPFQMTDNQNPFAADRRVLYLSDKWKRLIALIKHQALNGGYALVEGEFGAGKSTFGLLLEKKLLLDESVDCKRLQVHPLSTYEQLIGQLPAQPTKPLIVIVDDVHEASTRLLEQFTKPTAKVFWLLLGETGTRERVSDFYKHRHKLPLFDKQDCFEFLNKQLQDQPKYMQLSQMQSDTIWYAAKGLPKNILEQARKSYQKLIQGQESDASFEQADKGWLTSAILGLAVIVFVVFLFLSDSSPEQEAVAEQTSVAASEPAAAASQEHAAEADSEQHTQAGDSTEPETLSSPEQDPIAEIALKQQAVEAAPVIVASKPSFEQWFERQSRDHYSVQLYSNTQQAAAEHFQQSLDLADSYVFKARINGETRYRVLWGSYATRAEAEQAILSLPAHILEQQPWIRQFAAIAGELEK